MLCEVSGGTDTILELVVYHLVISWTPAILSPISKFLKQWAFSWCPRDLNGYFKMFKINLHVCLILQLQGR